MVVVASPSGSRFFLAIGRSPHVVQPPFAYSYLDRIVGNRIGSI